MVQSDKTVLDFLPQLQKALEYQGGTHTVADVADYIERGDAQLWVRDDAMIVTQVDQKPRTRHLVYWIACGDLHDVQELSEEIDKWGREQGCTLAVSHCRKGWKRAMSLYGWYENPDLIVLQKDL